MPVSHNNSYHENTKSAFLMHLDARIARHSGAQAHKNLFYIVCYYYYHQLYLEWYLMRHPLKHVSQYKQTSNETNFNVNYSVALVP